MNVDKYLGNKKRVLQDDNGDDSHICKHYDCPRRWTISDQIGDGARGWCRAHAPEHLVGDSCPEPVVEDVHVRAAKKLGVPLDIYLATLPRSYEEFMEQLKGGPYERVAKSFNPRPGNDSEPEF